MGDHGFVKRVVVSLHDRVHPVGSAAGKLTMPNLGCLSLVLGVHCIKSCFVGMLLFHPLVLVLDLVPDVVLARRGGVNLRGTLWKLGAAVTIVKEAVLVVVVRGLCVQN